MDYTAENPDNSSIDTSYLTVKEMIQHSSAFDSREKETLIQIFEDKDKCGDGVMAFIWPFIKTLVDRYKKAEVRDGDTIINVEMGYYGNIAIRNIEKLKSPLEKTLNYKPGDYDYVSALLESEQTILFTDFSKTEPYDRGAPMYVPYLFSNMTLVKSYPDKKYRELQITLTNQQLSWPVPGFSYNDVWGMVRFGLCLERKHVAEFMETFRWLIESGENERRNKIENKSE